MARPDGSPGKGRAERDVALVDTYRPHWAAAMTLISRQKTHLRSGWSAGLGFQPWCKRGRTDASTYLTNAVESAWVTVQEIQAREIHDPESKSRTCEGCCLAYMRAYQKHNN